jgi:dihydrodipicolinate synthase/N-acetylneuraminate lyase
MLPDTVQRLSRIPNIIGIKEASGSLERVREILHRCGDIIDVYAGDDGAALDVILMGGKGVISVTANVAPRLMHDMCAAARRGDQTTARAINDKLMPLHKELFIESNPIPVKWAVHRMGLIPPGIRLPLTSLSESCHAAVQRAMEHVNL